MCIYENTHIKHEIGYYNKTDVSEGIDINKIGASKGCIICHY